MGRRVNGGTGTRYSGARTASIAPNRFAGRRKPRILRIFFRLKHPGAENAWKISKTPIVLSVKPPVFDRQDGNLDCAPFGLVSSADGARSDPLLMQLLAAFLDDIKLIGFRIAEGLLQPPGPSDLYSVRLRGATQTEVQT